KSELPTMRCSIGRIFPRCRSKRRDRHPTIARRCRCIKVTRGEREGVTTDEPDGSGAGTAWNKGHLFKIALRYATCYRGTRVEFVQAVWRRCETKLRHIQPAAKRGGFVRITCVFMSSATSKSIARLSRAAWKSATASSSSAAAALAKRPFSIWHPSKH